MSIDFTKPVATADRAQNLTDTKDTLVAVAKQLDDTTPTGVATGMIRWSTTSSKWQKYNGTSWADLAATYNINVSHLGGQAAANYLLSATAATTYLALAGGTMTGNLTLSGAPTSGLHAATKQYVDDKPTVPTGSILMFGSASPPTGFLVCNGQAVSRTTYAALFAVIGTSFGIGDGSTTFNVPDMRDRMAVGAGNLYSLNSFGGSKDAIVVSHTHTATSTVTDPGHNHSFSANSGAYNGVDSPLGYGLQGASTHYTNGNVTGISVNTSISSTGSSGTGANMPPYRGLYFIIKT